MINSLRTTLRPLIDAVAKPFVWIHPDISSFGALLVAVPGFYFYAVGDSLLGSLFILGALFDTIDGAVARLRGGSSKFGGVLDATIDRIFEGLLVLTIGMGGLVSWPVLLIYYTASVGVSYIKAKAEAAAGQTTVGTNQFSVGIAQRGERILIIFLGSILNYFLTSDSNDILQGVFILLAVLSGITLVWRGWVIRKALQ